ncbi:MAG: ATP-binding protein [Anaeromyxobacteraceae bacterium]
MAFSTGFHRMVASRESSATSLRALACALGLAVAAVGALVIVGWGLGVGALTRLLPGYVPMRANTAAGLLFVGASVALHAGAPPRPVLRQAARALAALALLLGAVTVVEYAFAPALRLDEWLFPDVAFPVEAATGRMPVTTALALALLGASLLFIDTESPHGRRPAQLLALAAGLLPLQATIGWIYGLEPAAGTSPFTQVALHSGAALALLCVAVLLARPDRGLMRAVTSAGPSGLMARRLMPLVVLLPVALGWVFLVVGMRAGHYETLVGATFVVVSAVVTGVGLVWWNARDMQAMDEARSAAEEAVQDEREWLSTTLASIGDAVIATGPDGRVKSLNAVAESLTGWSSDSAAGRPLGNVFRVHGPGGSALEDPLDWAVREDRVADLPRDSVLVARSGAEFPVEGCASPIRDRRGRNVGVVVVFRDVRDRHRLEAERAALLAREQDARAEAEQASRAKDEFIATLSHELRTPLNSVLGWARLLRIGKLDADGVRRAVEAIERGATTQAQIVDDILDVSRIVRGQLKLDVRPVDLVPIVEAALETVRPAASARDIEVASVLAPRAGQVAGDPGRLQQVLWNLLANAIKFTPAGGRVEVRLSALDGWVELSVRDTGTGIPAEFLPHVFERFRQADSSTTRAHGGLGLGLAIVRHLVEAHGGTVAAESAGQGQGSTFTVCLPVAAVRSRPRTVEEAQPSPAPRALAAPPTGLDRLRILVVDDDRDTLEVMKQLLEEAGAEVMAAASAAEALSMLERQVPDVLVSDIGMPGQDGYSFIREVRRLAPERGGKVPAAALTAFTQSEARQQVLLAGFQLYLPKPIDPAELTDAVARLAGRG